MRKPVSIVLLVSLLAGPSVLGQQEIPGVRFVSSSERTADSNAHFTLGLTLDGGQTFTDSARVNDNVRIIGTIRPEAAQIGQSADIFVVDRVNLVFMMKNQDGLFVNWNGRVPDLVPVQENVTLQEEMEVDVFSGTLGETGDHRFFLGYLAEDGFLRYTPAPIRLDILPEQQDPQQTAFALFESVISPEVVDGICIDCHVSGGQADTSGAFHIFQEPVAASLQTNFDIFDALVARNGVSGILAKVRGENFHGGGLVLSSGTQLYEDFETFLNLLDQ